MSFFSSGRLVFFRRVLRSPVTLWRTWRLRFFASRRIVLCCYVITLLRQYIHIYVSLRLLLGLMETYVCCVVCWFFLFFIVNVTVTSSPAIFTCVYTCVRFHPSSGHYRYITDIVQCACGCRAVPCRASSSQRCWRRVHVGARRIRCVAVTEGGPY